MRLNEEAHRKLLVQTLDKAVAQMFLSCRLPPAEWDIDENLRKAFQEEDCLSNIKDTTKQYDQTIDIVKKFNITIDNKYFYLYKLIN